MNTDHKNIHCVISSYIEMDNDEWIDYSSDFQVKKINRKSLLLEERHVCKNVFFVEKGLLRIFFIDKEGEEKTFHFSVENTFATDYESLLRGIPSNYSIQALENTQVVIMSLEMLQKGYTKLRNGEKLGRLLAEDYFFIFSDKIQSIYTQSPIERYNNLTIKFPNIFQRVPQHLIASYLNISSVHLSRLKNADKWE